MLIQLLAIVVLAGLVWGLLRRLPLIIRIAGVVIGAFIVLHWLLASPHDVLGLLFHMVAMAVLLFIAAALFGGFRPRRR